ncbi:MAG: hypothetical protein GXO75_02015 [Calditrichaeota bacterium]|nr:hypothetical protein [Calditrichota bacterium]
MQQIARIAVIIGSSLHAMLIAEQRQNIGQATIIIAETHREKEDKTCEADN